MRQRPMRVKLENTEERSVHAEADEILNWVMHGKPYPKNPLYSRRKGQARTQLLEALREKLQTALLQLGRSLNTCTDDKQRENQKLLLFYLLAFYPYSEPKAESSIIVPHETEKYKWTPVEYVVKKLDISPQSSFVADLLKEEDRLHAYGLETREDLPSYLLFMGTPFPLNCGANLGMLHNFAILRSPGEAHDRSKVHTWMATQEQLILAGHSQGGIQAMILAAEQAHKIRQVFCFCPPRLSLWTLLRLTPLWRQASPQRPAIKVYTPEGDLLFSFGSGYLDGTEVHQMIYDRPSNRLLDRHVPCGAAHPSFQLLDITAQKKRSLKADFLAQAGVVGSPLIFLVRAFRFYHKLLVDKHKKRYLAPLALIYLGLNWFLYQKVFKNKAFFGILLMGFIVAQKSHKTAQAFWLLAQGVGAAVGGLYAAMVILPQQVAGRLSPVSSLQILDALKEEGSILVRRHSPVEPARALVAGLTGSGGFCGLMYSLWSGQRREADHLHQRLPPPLPQEGEGEEAGVDLSLSPG